ncbi:MAG: hypothetical protein ACRDCY_20935 [Aeromonas veronii]
MKMSWLLARSLFCHGLWAQELTLTTGEYPPYCSETLKYQGLIPHVVSEAFKSERVIVKFQFLPWKRAFRLSEEGGGWHCPLVWVERAAQNPSLQ